MFKPVMHFLQQKRAKDQRVKKGIEKKEQILLGLKKKKDKELFDFQKKMVEQYKVVLPVQPAISEIQSFKINKNEAEKLVVMAKEALMKRIPHVD